MSQRAHRPPRRRGRPLGVAAAAALSLAVLLPEAAPGGRAAAGLGAEAAAGGCWKWAPQGAHSARARARRERSGRAGALGAHLAKDGPGAELGAEVPGPGGVGRRRGLTASEEARLRWLEARLAKVKAREKAIAAKEGVLQQQWRKATSSVGKRQPGLGSGTPAYPWDVEPEARADEPRYPWEAIYGTQAQFLEKMVLAPEGARRPSRAAS